MFGLNFLGPLSMATMGDGRPDNTPEDLAYLTKAFAAARAARLTPNGHVADAFNRLPFPQGSDPMTAGGLAPPAAPVTPQVSDGSFNSIDAAAAPQATPALPPAAVPMPQPRPEEAPTPQPGGMGFFARNTAMMRDPVTGDFLDPTAGRQAEASGPDLIQKYMTYLHGKNNA